MFQGRNRKNCERVDFPRKNLGELVPAPAQHHQFRQALRVIPDEFPPKLIGSKLRLEISNPLTVR